MTRREAISAAAAACITPAFLHGNSPMAKFKQSIVAWCFEARGPKWSFDHLCQVSVKLGCPSVEIVGPESFATLKKHNLTCAISTNGLGFKIGFNNLAHREELVAKTKSIIQSTKEARFPSVISFVGMKWHKPDDPNSGEISQDDAFKNCVEGLKLVAGDAEKAGVNICLEHLNSRDGSDPMTGHPGYQGDNLDWVVSILKAVGSPRVKLLFDIYHVQIMHGDLIRRIEECKDWIGHIHTAGVPGRHELDGTQEIHYPAVMKKLAAIGYSGYVGHEFLPTRDAEAGLVEAIKACTV
ncbi:MAG: TIM barrel protein [Gemmataceae bacterium]